MPTTPPPLTAARARGAARVHLTVRLAALGLASLTTLWWSPPAQSGSRWPHAACEAGTPLACLMAAKVELAAERPAPAFELSWRAFDLDEPLTRDFVFNSDDPLTHATVAGLFEAVKAFPWAEDRAATARADCDGGSGRACLSLSALHEVGFGVAFDEAASSASLDRACTLDAWACSAKALVVARDFMDPQRLPNAAALLSRSCAAGNAAGGCRRLGDRLATTFFGARDPAGSLKAYEAGCKAGDPVCCRKVADGRGGARQAAEIAALYDRACNSGDPVACVQIARRKVSGIGTAKDPAGAARVLAAACEIGIGHACADLGQYYELGVGVPKDAPRAVSLYERGCDLGGGVPACTALGLALVHGAHITADPLRGQDAGRAEGLLRAVWERL